MRAALTERFILIYNDILIYNEFVFHFMKEEKDIAAYPHGSFLELQQFIQAL